MADFKIGNTTPAVGNIKLGSSNVSKIYKGTTLVWPTFPANTIAIPCSLRIWTTTNSSLLAGTSSGSAVTIPIVTNETAAMAKCLNQEYAAAYWNFDSNNAHMGLFYNEWAAKVLNPPTGFRKPTKADWSSLLVNSCISSTDRTKNPKRYNVHASPITATSGWDTDTASPHPRNNVNYTFSDFANVGESGLNITGHGSGYIFYGNNFNWDNFNGSNFWMFDTQTTLFIDSANETQTALFDVVFSNVASERYMSFAYLNTSRSSNMQQMRHMFNQIRFCKDNI
jgi:hypothetical protein